MKIMIINGPNINMLGIRETNLYGITFYRDLEKKIKIWAKENNLKVEIHQSNYEGKIIDLIQKAYFKKFNGIILNAGGYTHTSISILDALNVEICGIQDYLIEQCTKQGVQCVTEHQHHLVSSLFIDITIKFLKMCVIESRQTMGMNLI